MFEEKKEQREKTTHIVVCEIKRESLPVIFRSSSCQRVRKVFPSKCRRTNDNYKNKNNNFSFLFLEFLKTSQHFFGKKILQIYLRY